LRPPIDTILAPPFPGQATWVNSEPLKMDGLRGRPVLIEFWDFCRPNSLRTRPYLDAWHGRYSSEGLVIVGAHAPGFRASAREEAAREAIDRLKIEHPVMLDTNFALWQEYENEGWPARYLWDADGHLADYHYGEGAYRESELAIQSLLGVEREPLAPIRPEDEPGARLVVPSEERREEPFSGPYEAGAVWAVLEPRLGRSRGTIAVNGRELAVEHPAAVLLIEHERHSRGVLELDLGADVRCDAVCFTPGLA
jgi:hypothetical protein